MRRIAVLLGTIATVTVVAPPATAAVERHRLRFGPVAVGGFETAYPRGRVAPPPVDGFITGMHARIVDRHGRPVTVRDVMLHHVFFNRRRAAAVDRPCAGRHHETFYGTGEEDQRLRLPAGYGYRVRARDRWWMGAMLMSHTTRSLQVYIEYTVDVETRERLTPVQAFWLRANGCDQGSGYHLRGDGLPGTAHEAVATWTVPYDLRIVAAGGHLHGGARDLWLSQPGCGDRRVLDNRPSYGMPDHLYYRARPVLHEPGPVDTRFFVSATGVAARAGEQLTVHGLYDADLPRTVMAVMHVYVARGSAGAAPCAALPADARHLTKPGPTRSAPPRTPIPLTGLDERGRTYTIADLPGPVTALGADPVVTVDDAGFAPARFTLPGPTTVTWSFSGAAGHNVRLASGPRLIVTPTLRGTRYPTPFTAPGRYTLFCTAHPVTMHAIVDVLDP